MVENSKAIKKAPLSEPYVRRVLLEFLARNADPVRTLRSYRQMIDNEFVPYEGLLDWEAEIITKSSRGALKGKDSSLCEISDTSQKWGHDDRPGTEFWHIEEGLISVRGMWFKFQFRGYNFECVDLDGGLSRAFFDKKDLQGREKFVFDFANRTENSPLPKVVAFITDTGTRHYIDQMAIIQPTPTVGV